MGTKTQGRKPCAVGRKPFGLRMWILDVWVSFPSELVVGVGIGVDKKIKTETRNNRLFVIYFEDDGRNEEKSRFRPGIPTATPRGTDAQGRKPYGAGSVWSEVFYEFFF